MKLSSKLLLSYLAVAFLVLLVGAGTFLLNNHIKNSLIEDSQRSINELQRLSNLESNLQNSLLFTRNFIFEHQQEVEDQEEIRLNSRNAEAAARDYLHQFGENLESIRDDIPESSEKEGELARTYREMARFADSLSSSFELYSSLIYEIFELDDDIELRDEMFNMTIEPYFRTTLLPILEQFRSSQTGRVEHQLSTLRTQADRNTMIIIVITFGAFMLALAMAYIIYNSIARPVKHLTLATDEIGAGNLDKRIQIGTNDELEQLGESFNKMAENLNRSMVSREYVNNIIQSMGDMLVVTDQNFEIELINQSISETLRYSEEELMGESFWSLVSGDQQDILKKRIADSSQKVSFETRYRTKEGEEIPVILSFSHLSENGSRSKGIVLVASNITAQKEAEEKINRSLKEKEVLLAEIHHRVKNNLAVISGLLEMQVWNLPDDDKSINPLKESQLRIHSIALVHELLYQSESFSEIQLNEYIGKLLQAIQKTHKKREMSVDIATDLGPIYLTIQKAIPASLLLNELVVNSYKHAFEEQSSGQIDVQLAREEGQVKLVVQDNGVGLPEDFDPFEQETLGMTLIKTLVRQIEGDFYTEPRRDGVQGARFVVLFEED